MKKFLHLLVFFCLCVVGVGSSYAQIYTLDTTNTSTKGSNSAYASNGNVTVNGITWNVNGNNTMNPWRIGGNSISNVDRTVQTKTPISSDISKIELELGAASSITFNSFTFTVSKDPNFLSPIYTNKNKPATSSTTIFEKPDGQDWSNCYYKFVFNVSVTGGTNRFIEFKKVIFYEAEDSSGGDSTIDPDNKTAPTTITFDPDPSAGPITTSTPVFVTADGNPDPEIKYSIGVSQDLIYYNKETGILFPQEAASISLYVEADNGVGKGISKRVTYIVKNPDQGETGGEGEGELSSYTILFKTASSNNSNSQFSISSQPSAVLEDGSDYVKSFTAVTLSYPEGIGGARIGQNSSDGKLSFDLTEKGQVVPTKIVCLISANKASTKMKINDNEYTVSSAFSNGNYVTCELPVSNDILKSFTIEKTGSNIGYIRSITVYYKTSTEGGSDPTPKEYTALDQYDDTEDITFELDGSYQLELGDDHPEISWTFDPDGVISIDTNGKITATSEGDVFITGKWGDDKTWTKGEVNFLVTVTDNQGGEVTPPTPGEDLTDSAWVKVTANDQLVLDGKYIIATSGTYGKNTYNVAMGFVTGTNTYLNCPTVKFSDNGNEIVFSETENKGIINDVAVISFDGTSLDASALSLYTLSGDSKGFYKASADKNATISKTRESEAKVYLNSNGSIIIDFDKGGSAKLGKLYYNGNSPRFANYTNAQEAIYLYKLKEPEKTPEFPVVKIGEEMLENNGSKTVAKGTEITISSENAKSIKVQYESDAPESLSQEPFTYPVVKSGTYTIWGVNGKKEGNKFTYSFTIGEVDPNMPAPGSTFKLVHHNNPELLTEGYYVIGRKEANLAMGRTGNNNIAAITDSYDIKEINTNPFNLTVASVNAKPFNVITTKDDNVLIVKLEKNEASQWGIKTVNYEDGFTTSQGYLKADASGTALTLSKDFVPLNIELTTSDNVDIYFEDKKDKKTIKYVTSGGGNFSYQNSGSAIQLYKYTKAKEFVADYGIFSIPQGEPRKAMPLNEEYPENIKYWIKGNTTVISMDEGSDIIQTNPDRTSDELKEHPFVYAAWDETDDWFGGITQFQVIVKYYLNAKQFGFEYDEIRGKKDVGVAAQAARYLGTGKVEYRVYDVYDIETQTFMETPETELSINHETGMIRPEDIVNAKLNKDYIVVATVDETDEHMSAYRSYIIRIEDFTPPTVSNKATFDFTSSGSYGLFAFDGTNQKNSKGEEVYEGNIEEQIDSRYQDHTSVSTIYADEDKNISLKFTGKYRDWTGSSNDYHLRVYSESTMSISVPEGYSISSIEFSSPNSTANGNNFTTSTSSKDNIWSDGNSKWNAPYGGINKLTFTAKATIRISQITVEIEAPNHGEKTLSTLSFPDDARLYNIFVGETETISGLTSSAVPFELIEYDIDNVEGINGNLDEDEYEQDPFTNYVINPKWNDEKNAVDIDVTVNTPGIYTFRAYNESDDQYYAGMAILRLNVFPRLEVLPKSDGDLADDVRTEHPQLTLVNHDEDEKATIKLPNLCSLNNDYKYSTVTLNVEVKHGNEITNYSSSSEKGIPPSIDFKEDGYVRYEMLYANTDDFKKEETVHVVLMPSWNFTTEGKSITIIPTANSTLQYCYFQTRYYDEDGMRPGEYGESAKKGVKARAATEEKVNDWVTTNEATEFSVDKSKFEQTEGYWIGVKYRTVKDVNAITGLGLEDSTLASDYNTILFTDSGIPTGIDDIHTDFSDFDSEGEAVYFNLQGQKVNKPERGVYIIVKDGKAEKVMF